MPYNTFAESYARSHAEASSRYFMVLDELFAKTCEKGPFRVNELVGEIAPIQHLAPKTQGEILRVVLRDSVNPPPEGDGWKKEPGGRYSYVEGTDTSESDPN